MQVAALVYLKTTIFSFLFPKQTMTGGGRSSIIFGFSSSSPSWTLDSSDVDRVEN